MQRIAININFIYKSAVIFFKKVINNVQNGRIAAFITSGKKSLDGSKVGVTRSINW